MKTIRTHESTCDELIEKLEGFNLAVGNARVRVLNTEKGKTEEFSLDDLKECARMGMTVQYSYIQTGMADYVFIITDSSYVGCDE